MDEIKSKKRQNNGISSSYALNGHTNNIHHLVYHAKDVVSGEVLVFVDTDLDLDWECDDTASDYHVKQSLNEPIRKIQNRIALIEPIAHNWPKDLKLAAKRIMGESIASALVGDTQGAEVALQASERFIKNKSVQVSRYWILQICLLCGLIAAIIATAELCYRLYVINLSSLTFYTTSMCFWLGCIGALFFIIMRLGNQPKIDSTAERHLHYLEGIARIIAGGIAGIIAGTLVNLGLILPVFNQIGKDEMSLFIAALLAGSSEHFASGIITKIEANNEIN